MIADQTNIVHPGSETAGSYTIPDRLNLTRDNLSKGLSAWLGLAAFELSDNLIDELMGSLARVNITIINPEILEAAMQEITSGANLGPNTAKVRLLNEITKVANELDLRGLYEEADTLDSIIKEASLIDWAKSLFGAEITCAEITAAAMGGMADHVRASVDGCEAAGYEYSVDDSTKLDIVRALKRLAKNDPDPNNEYARALKKYVNNHTEHSMSFYEAMAEGRGINGVKDFLKDVIMFRHGTDWATSSLLGVLKDGLKARLITNRIEEADKALSYGQKVDRQGNVI